MRFRNLMLSQIDASMNTATTFTSRRTPLSVDAVRAASDLLLAARERERAGDIPEAIERYENAITQAEKSSDYTVVTEALRRLAVVRHQRGERDIARQLCQRSLDVARSTKNDLLAG